MLKIQQIRKHYERRVNATRPGYDILDWSSAEAQTIRFNVLVRLMAQELAGTERPALLDVGCGMADLAAFLDEHGIDTEYIGTDITFKVVREAQRRDPDRNLLLADVFSAPPFPKRAFDAVFCSGVFNLKLGNNDAFVIQAILSMIPLCRGILVVNMLHRRCRRKYLHCHYFDPDHIRHAIESRGYSVEVIDDYLDNDFSVVVNLHNRGPADDGKHSRT